MRRRAIPPRPGSLRGGGLALLALAGCAAPASGPAAPREADYITAGEAVAWPALPADEIVAYGPAPEQFAELRLPRGPGPHPVAAVFHGGCWLSIADNDYMDRVARAFTDAGWATWNVEFRTLDQPGGGWPGTFEDVGAGLDALRGVADRYDLDLSRVVTVGHSSGGHLALWAASRHRIEAGTTLHTADPLRPAGAVGLAAIADLAHYDAMDVPACGETPGRLLGAASVPDAPGRAAQASPAALVPTGTPQILFTGVDDYAVPPAHGEAYAERARATGQAVEHHVLPGANHFEVVAPGTAAWDLLWPRVEAFLAGLAPTTPGVPAPRPR